MTQSQFEKYQEYQEYSSQLKREKERIDHLDKQYGSKCLIVSEPKEFYTYMQNIIDLELARIKRQQELI